MGTELAPTNRATAWRTAPDSAGRWRQPRGGPEAPPSPAAQPKPALRSLVALPTTTPRARHHVDLGQLPSIDLDTLAERGELLTRMDRKYLVDLAVVPQLVAALSAQADGTAALELGGRRQFGYESVYYDTPTLTSYLQAARQRPHRFKVRSRSYLDSGHSFLEVKTRDGQADGQEPDRPATDGQPLGTGAGPARTVLRRRSPAGPRAGTRGGRVDADAHTLDALPPVHAVPSR